MTKEETRGGRRKCAGRPALFHGEKRAINLKLTVKAIDLLTQSAESASISRSDLINRLIYENLKP